VATTAAAGSRGVSASRAARAMPAEGSFHTASSLD
jgi:hypothetical protein